MSNASGKLGRPTNGDDSGEMNQISFRVDAETLHALKVLEERARGHVRGYGLRSVLLRKLIMEAFQKV